MREIQSEEITRAVARLFQEANFHLPEDVMAALRRALRTEESDVGRQVLGKILENAEIAAKGDTPLCQDTGAAVVFLDIGQEVHIAGGDLAAAVNEGVRQGYKDGYLRKSMVRQPYSARQNTGDNTPAIIHTQIVSGESMKITVLPKGGGAENMTRLGMLSPSQGREGVVALVEKAVEEAGSNPCPPVIIGVAIGGTPEKAVLLAKRALCRRLGEPSPDSETAKLESEILDRVNRLGIGPMGYGGRTTALAVHVEIFPAHIASLPVAVNIQCHSARHREIVL